MVKCIAAIFFLTVDCGGDGAGSGFDGNDLNEGLDE